MLQIVGVGSLEPPKGEGGGEEWFFVCGGFVGNRQAINLLLELGWSRDGAKAPQGCIR